VAKKKKAKKSVSRPAEAKVERKTKKAKKKK
jgi:hypothetical protein